MYLHFFNRHSTIALERLLGGGLGLGWHNKDQVVSCGDESKTDATMSVRRQVIVICRNAWNGFRLAFEVWKERRDEIT